MVAALILLAGSTLLGVASWITPDPMGFGSHRQWGSPACTSIVLVGYPCPTCGMTTAFAHTVRGELVAAFWAQPAGLVLALATILVSVLSLNVLIDARVWSVNWYRVSPALVLALFFVLVLLGWGLKIADGVTRGVFPVMRS